MRRPSRKGEVLTFIVAYVRANGYPPSVREIQQGLGWRSTATPHHYLTELAKDGAIAWKGDGSNRAIRLLGEHCPCCGQKRPG